MFLQKQLYFYKIYYRFTDALNLCVITWDSKKEVFKKKHLPKRNIIMIHLLLYLCYPYMIRSNYLFIKILRESSDDSSATLLSNTMHMLGNCVLTDLLLCRTLCTFRSEGVVELMNAMLTFEKRHLKGEFEN